MVCDEVAAARTRLPLDIAGALIKLRRQTSPRPKGAPVKLSSSAFVPDGSRSFERRVRRLIGFADGVPGPEQAALMSIPRRGRLALIAAVFTTALLAIPLLAPLAVHHAAEALINIIG